MFPTGKFDLAEMVSMKSRGILSSRTTSGHGRTSETVGALFTVHNAHYTSHMIWQSAHCYRNHEASHHVFHLTYYGQLQEILVDESFIQYPLQD